MAIMHWNDWQIEEFLSAKTDTGKHWTTNISVEVDNEFFIQAEDPYSEASLILHRIAEGMLANGEPGFWNSELSNVGEPNPVIATNPCGEIALEAWENCNLGHVNLSAFVSDDGVVDELGMYEAHRLVTRFLIRATFGDVNDAGQAAVLARNRRIGVGHFGVASFLGMIGERYSDAYYSDYFRDLLKQLARTVDAEAVRYSHNLRIPIPVKTRTVAPTGTIAKMPGVSEGIHPIFAKYFIRRIRLSTIDPDQVATLEDYKSQGFNVVPCQYAPNTMVIEIPTKDSLLARVEKAHPINADWIVQSAGDLGLNEMLAFQALYQEVWADNAVSYTANVDQSEYSVEELALALQFWGPKLKGATVFPETSMPQAPYERITEADYELYRYTQVADSLDENCVTGACPVR
jgi:adenosylcobalamin-dependent ribonucleoside-triphosphate reductase